MEIISIDTHPEAVFERRSSRMRRSVWWAGYAHGAAFSGHYGERPWFVTLTYRPGVEWSKEHVSGALKACRIWLKRQGGGRLRYTWVAELQKRGAVHYHLIIYLPKRLSMPKWDKQGWWKHGMTNVQPAKAGCVGYLMKYVSKANCFQQFPAGMRLFGIGGLNEQARSIRAWHNLPSWLKHQYGVGEITRRACGYLVRATGELLESPWVLYRGAGNLLLRLHGELPAPFASGPYSRVGEA